MLEQDTRHTRFVPSQIQSCRVAQPGLCDEVVSWNALSAKLASTRGPSYVRVVHLRVEDASRSLGSGVVKWRVWGDLTIWRPHKAQEDKIRGQSLQTIYCVFCRAEYVFIVRIANRGRGTTNQGSRSRLRGVGAGVNWVRFGPYGDLVGEAGGEVWPALSALGRECDAATLNAGTARLH